MQSRLRLIRFAAAGLTAVLLIILLRPVPAPDVEVPTETTAFRWDADELFTTLENEFAGLENVGVEDADEVVSALELEGAALLTRISGSREMPGATLDRLATLQFELAVRGAAYPRYLARVQDFFIRARVDLMRAATMWEADRATHEALYRVITGGRMALDEALIQAGVETLSPLLQLEDIQSEAPSIVVEGVRIHSGDILLSRGGAPTSALIARGNDFPNTFSHAALAHVDQATGEGTVIESLIEAGSVLTSVEEYLASKKHRILVLRLQPEHRALASDPLVAHHAASALLASIRERHLPYDFAMDWEDPSAAFCSEIVYHAYLEQGVDLWTRRSPMSAPGLVGWLAMMGVREFTSLVPSDIEFDPQLRAVVEWRDAPALMDFRLDNAVIDALLEEAERGAELGFAWYTLPAARLLKGFSLAQSLVGATPEIPQGMTAATALRVNALISTVHPAIKDDLTRRAEAFHDAAGYEAPYWVLVELAREALAATRTSLPPALVTP
jgi:hypothetical protein